MLTAAWGYVDEKRPIMNALQGALGDISQAGINRTLALAGGAVNDLTRIGGEAAKLAGPTAQQIADAISHVAAGRYSVEVGYEIVERLIASLDEVRLGGQEAAAVAAVKRAKEMLTIASEVGLALAKAVVSIGIAAL